MKRLEVKAELIGKYLNWVKERVFSSIPCSIFSISAGFSLGYLIFTNFYQKHYFGWRYLLYSIGFIVFFSFISGWIYTNYFSKTFYHLGRKNGIVLIGVSFLLSVIFLINAPIQPIYYLLPDSQFEISFEIDDHGAGSEGVQLLWIHTGQGFIHHSNMEIDGEWKVFNDGLLFQTGQKASIHWVGKAGSQSEMVFLPSPYDQIVNIAWNGKESRINLFSTDLNTIEFFVETPIPAAHSIAYAVFFLISISYLTFLFLTAMIQWKPKPAEEHPARSNSWVFYMGVMASVWLFSLLVFWPGVFSNDSLDLWNQAVSGNLNDWQSAFYAAILYLLVKINDSLGFIIILQIVYFSFLIAFGLGQFEKRGVPKPVLWMICILMAASPLNNMQVITLWKDLPYTASFLWLTILIFNIIDSNGSWILQRKNAALLLINSILISLLRLNGLPVAAVSILALALAFKKERKRFLAILAGLIMAFLLIKGPVYELLRVDRDRSGQSNLILLHHFAAHLDAGTYLEESERGYLNELLPLSEWDYQCCYIGPVYLRRGFNQPFLVSNGAYNRQLALQLFLRNPLVDIRHVFCAGEMAWRFGESQCRTYSSHGFNSWRFGKEDWIIPNQYALAESSFFPGLVRSYSNTLRYFGFLDELLVPYLRPAFYLYLLIISLVIASFRNKDWKVFLIGLPVILQTGLLFLINFAPVIRYFYSTTVIGVFLIGLMFYKKRQVDR